jgi:hypothetical protein
MGCCILISASVSPYWNLSCFYRFADVIGIDAAKEELMELVDYLKHPTKYKSVGARVPHGFLLVGEMAFFAHPSRSCFLSRSPSIPAFCRPTRCW